MHAGISFPWMRTPSFYEEGMISDKDAYRALCQVETSIPLFSRDWWLDIVCGERNWNVLLCQESEQIEAAMPIYVPWRGKVTMPFYTQTMGPWIAPEAEDAKYATRLARRQALMQSFVERLSPYSYFYQHFSSQITDWLPFYWAGFSQTTRYTYRLYSISDTTRLWEEMSQSVRRHIRKAGKLGIEVQAGLPVGELLRLQALSFARQGLKPKGRKVLKQLVEEARRRGVGEIFGAYDAGGRLHAAVFIVWQKSSAYYIAGGGDPQFRDSGAHTLALWEAIQFVSRHTDCFDFEGSMLPGVERAFREFGAKQVPYFAIKKGNLSLYNRACLKLGRISL